MMLRFIHDVTTVSGKLTLFRKAAFACLGSLTQHQFSSCLLDLRNGKTSKRRVIYNLGALYRSEHNVYDVHYMSNRDVFGIWPRRG